MCMGLVSFVSWTVSGETASGLPCAGQMLSLWCKQGRHKFSHPANSLKTGKGLGVYLLIWVEKMTFYWSRSKGDLSWEVLHFALV